MHKTQGFGNFIISARTGTRFETLQLLDGAPMKSDVMDGIDTPCWGRIPGGAEIGKLTEELIDRFDSQNPVGSVPGLLKVRAELAALAVCDPVVTEKRDQLDRIFQACLDPEVQTTISRAEAVPGETMKLHDSVVIHSGTPVRWVAAHYPGIKQQIDQGTIPGPTFRQKIELLPNQPRTLDSTPTRRWGCFSRRELPTGTPLSQPYWLREEGSPGLFRVDDPSLIGRPENPCPFPIEYVFEIGEQTLVIPDEPVQITTNSENSEMHHRMEVIPPVSLDFISDIALFAPGTSHPVEVEVVASRPDSIGTLRLETSQDWNVSPSEQSFHLKQIGERARFTFTITAPPKSGTANIIADVEIARAHYRNRRIEINYPHVPPILLQTVASLKAISFELRTLGHTIGYLPGAGGNLAQNLKQMGYAIRILDDTNLTLEELQGLDAVVIGVRAFNVRSNIGSDLPLLFRYVENGGTIVAQYNQPDGLKTNKLAPLELHLSTNRVTEKTAAATLLAPDHTVLNKPNKITSTDFDGWVQERGIYLPDGWNDHFTPVLAFNDPDGSALKGGFLVAPSAKGYLVYTCLAFFRELPAGVPGAFRLFANLISLGK